MASTIPNEYVGKGELTQEHLDAIEEGYQAALGNEDHASDVEDHNYYWGVRLALEAVLDMAYGKKPMVNLIDWLDM